MVAETADGRRALRGRRRPAQHRAAVPGSPPWAELDGDRLLTTRDAYPPQVLPDHLVVIGSGVTGVEFVHMFSSLGCEVTLIVSRQQVLPQKDPEVAAVLEADFSRRGVHLLKGARAVGVDQAADGVVVRCDDGRVVRGRHALLAIGSVPNSEGLGLETAGVEVDEGGYVPINRHCQTNVPHIFAAGDLSGKLPLSSVASMQGRKIAEYVVGGHTVAHRHPNYDKRPVGHLHRARDRRRGPGRGGRLRRGSEDPGDQGPLRRQLPGPHRQRLPRLREDHHRSRPPASCWAAPSWAGTPPSSSRCWRWP